MNQMSNVHEREFIRIVISLSVDLLLTIIS